jgi:S1/P1 Nuclease
VSNGQDQYSPLCDELRVWLRIVVVALSALVICSAPAWSWGLDGHRTSGMIADLILESDPKGAAAKQLLGGQSLSEASLWADCAKGYCNRPLSAEERIYVKNNPQHKVYHYTDVAIQQPQYKLGTAGTREDDVVQVSKQAINILRGRPPNQGPAVLDRKSALWVLAHLIGDIHQPLHVGAVYYDQDCKEVVDPNVVGAGKPNFGIGSTVATTTGGNDLKLPNGKSFHIYWDTGTVIGAMRLAGVKKKSIEEFAKYIFDHPPIGWETSGDAETWPEQWATEVMPLANAALSRIKIGNGTQATGGLKCTWPVTLDRDYTSWANQQALAQLGKAGFRLAALLRAVLP